MKKIILLLAVAVLTGCSYAGQQDPENYLQGPASWIKDPHFENYKQKLDDLERKFLDKKISYADYLDQKKALDDQYAKEVQERNEKIMGDQQP